jgi:outer membrane protein assembly factor BamB
MKKIKIAILLIIVGIFLINLIYLLSVPYWAMPVAVHDIAHVDTSLQELWRRNEIFIGEDQQSNLVAGDGKVFILGSDERKTVSKIMAFDAVTGALLWSTREYIGTALIFREGHLLVGGIGEVISFNPADGSRIWTKKLPLGRSVLRLYFIDEVVYADMGTRYFIMSPQTGEILREVHGSDFEDEPPFWLNPPNGWETFLGGRISLHRATGWVHWDAEENLISKAAFNQSKLFALTEDGQLLQIDLTTDITTRLVLFKPTPFMLQNERGNILNYYVSGDANYLFAYLGDSGQLFAFKLSQ